MKKSKQPWKSGKWIVKHSAGVVVAPPGWYRLMDGSGFAWDGSKGPEHSGSGCHSLPAYRFSKRNAEIVAANCCGQAVEVQD